MNCGECDNINSNGCKHVKEKSKEYDLIWYGFYFIDCIFFCRSLIYYWNKRTGCK